MCGIFAVFGKEKPKNLDKVREGFETLKSRGPDNHILLEKPKKGIFGFTRLSIVGISKNGVQPFIKGEKLMLCNGEIYNYKELIEKYNLKYDLKSDSDCEVILALYEKLNSFEKVVSLLDGVFSLYLFDNGKSWFIRDKIGVRPMFMGKVNKNTYAVASLAKALLPFCSHVEAVIPGVCYHYDRKQLSGKPLLKMEQSLHKMVNLTSIKHEMFERLKNSVKKRLMSDRPLGCLLSGGLDSSIVASLLCKFIGAHNVRTYSIGMEGGLDLKYARKVAHFLGTNHTEVKFTPEQGLEAIPEVIRSLESYDVTTVRASVGMYLLAKYISENTQDKVIFSGEGSDELFCGYLYFHNAPTKKEASEESLRLMYELYKYDVLRADRVVSCHGLELRVPFLDKEVLDLSLRMSEEWKAPVDGWEKFVLRHAFSKMLPKEIAWRRKDGFSDAVSSLEKPWYKYIQEWVDTKISDQEYKEENGNGNGKKYISKEAMYYRQLFNNFFPSYNLNLPTWMPKWSGDLKDPSGRLIKAFDEK